MSNSTLVNCTMISPNKNAPRDHVIDTITIHCVVGQLSAESIGNCFASPSAQASCNYGIGTDGRVVLCVEEKDRSWCSSSAANDNRAVTIECASDTTHPYAINDKVYKSLINLCVDICQRNGIQELKWRADKSLIGQPDKQNMTVHRWFANKACPGDYIYERLGDIAAKVNAKLGVSFAPTTPAIPLMFPATIWSINGCQFPPKNFFREISLIPVRVSALPCSGNKFKGTLPRRAWYAATIWSIIWSVTAGRLAKSNSFSSAVAFLATLSMQICLIFNWSQMGSMPGSVQLNSEITASMPPVASMSSRV